MEYVVRISYFSWKCGISPISAFHQYRRRFKFDEHVPQWDRKLIVHPAQKRHSSSCEPGTIRSVVSLSSAGLGGRLCCPGEWDPSPDRRATTPNATKPQLVISTELSRSATSMGHLVNSATTPQIAIAASDVGHDLLISIGTTLIHLVRSRVVVILEP